MRSGRYVIWGLIIVGIIASFLLVIIDNPVILVAYFALYLLLIIASIKYFYEDLRKQRLREGVPAHKHQIYLHMNRANYS